jgi:hypothetical protein
VRLRFAHRHARPLFSRQRDAPAYLPQAHRSPRSRSAFPTLARAGPARGGSPRPRTITRA